jgi:hypothetical protein
MKKICQFCLISFSGLFLTGCIDELVKPAPPKLGPNGTPMYTSYCNGHRNTMVSCINKAINQCPHGYVEIAKETIAEADELLGGSYIRRYMIYECK